MNILIAEIIMKVIPFVAFVGGSVWLLEKGMNVFSDFSEHFRESQNAKYLQKHGNELEVKIAMQINQYIRTCNKQALIDLLNKIANYKGLFYRVAQAYQKLYNYSYKADCGWLNKIDLPAGGNLWEHLQILLGDDFDINILQ